MLVSDLKWPDQDGIIGTPQPQTENQPRTGNNLKIKFLQLVLFNFLLLSIWATDSFAYNLSLNTGEREASRLAEKYGKATGAIDSGTTLCVSVNRRKVGCNVIFNYIAGDSGVAVTCEPSVLLWRTKHSKRINHKFFDQVCY